MPDSGNLPNKPRRGAAHRENRATGYGATPYQAERPRRSFERAKPSDALVAQTSPERPRRRRSGKTGETSLRESASRFDFWSALFGPRTRRSPRAGSSRPSKEIALQRLAQSTQRPPQRERPREVLQSVFSTERVKRFEPADRTQGRFSRRAEFQPSIGSISRYPVRGDVKPFTPHGRQSNPFKDIPSRELDNGQRLSPSERLRGSRERHNRPLTVLPFNDAASRANDRSHANRSRTRSRRMEVVSSDSPTRLESSRVAVPRSRTVSPSARRESRSVQPLPRSVTAAVYIMRMLILSVGVGVLAGTTLSVWDPASRAPAGASQQATQQGTKPDADNKPASPGQASVNLGQEIAALKASVQAIVTKGTAQSAQLAPGVFLLELDTNAYLDINGGASVPAASVIKIPVLIAFFQDVDAGKIRLDELLTMRKELIATGSGDMQYQAAGTQYSALETATKMITVSDNTATNMLIARLGGLTALNQRMKSWGLTATTLNHLLPDLEGTNTTSPKEMALLLARLSQGDLVSMRSRDRILEIMRRTENDSMLPQGLGDGVTIAHKTGTISSMLGDVGLIDLPNGKRYIAAVLVKRAANDEQAQTLIQQISQISYQYFNHALEAQNVPSDSALPASPNESPVPQADVDSPQNLNGLPIDPGSTAQIQQPAR